MDQTVYAISPIRSNQHFLHTRKENLLFGSVCLWMTKHSRKKEQFRTKHNLDLPSTVYNL